MRLFRACILLFRTFHNFIRFSKLNMKEYHTYQENGYWLGGKVVEAAEVRPLLKPNQKKLAKMFYDFFENETFPEN